MKHLINLLLTLFIVSNTTAQDESLYKKINKPRVNCEDIAWNSNELIASYSLSQPDSIIAILNIWEELCGTNEPIERSKILLQMSKGENVDSLFIIYYKKYNDIFSDKKFYNNDTLLTDIEWIQEEYNYRKEYFSYVPIIGTFEKWFNTQTRELAKNIDSTSNEFLICEYFTEPSYEFYRKITSRKFKDTPLADSIKAIEIKEQEEDGIVQILGGTLIPSEKMSRYIYPSPYFEFRFIGIHNSYRFGYGINLGWALHKKKLPLFIEDTLRYVNSKAFLGTNLFFGKNYTLNKYWSAYTGVGFGVQSIQTGYRLPYDIEDEPTHDIVSFDAMIEADIIRRVKLGQVGIRVSYHLAPLSNHDIIQADIGNSFSRIALFYQQ